MLVWLVPLLPFFGFVFQVFIGRRLPKPIVSLVSCGVVAASAVIAWVLFFHLRALPGPRPEIAARIAPWISVPGAMQVVADHKLVVDPLTAVMILVVTNIGFLIHLYSTGYMAEEKRYARYFAFLNLFTGFMLVLVMASNLLLMFVGWEGVGLCSYLLIGFWFEKKENAAAGMKAFIVNRIGDFGFMIGLLALFVYVGTEFKVWTLDFGGIRDVIEANPGKFSVGMATFIGLMMFVGATGKSAQIPLFTWLPDAMAGPTPVSALIHAATMVTAGVYMVARMNFLYVISPAAMAVVAGVGAATALLAGTIGMAQNDIKKVLAYSTVSQLGFMFMGVGVGAFAAGIFHLFTHAFFKACLFLGSGSVIHGMGGEQDIRKMGALKSKMPWTFLTFAVASLAIAGIPPLAGFVSKDEILWRTFSTGRFSGWLAVSYWGLGALAALCTAFYMTRLVVKTFYGRPNWDVATAHSGGGAGHDEHSVGGDLPEDESLLDLPRMDRASHGAGGGHGGGHGARHAGEPHESPISMVAPLILLALGSIVVGFLAWPHALGGGDAFGHWLEPVVGKVAAGNGPRESHAFEYGLMILSVGIALIGIGAAWVVYRRKEGAPARAFAERNPVWYGRVLNKYYVDEAYDRAVVQPLLQLNERTGRFDNEVIDGAVNAAARGGATLSKGTGYFDNEVVDAAVNAAANATQAVGGRVRRIQSGNIRHYLTFALVGGLFVIAFFCLYGVLGDKLRRLFGG